MAEHYIYNDTGNLKDLPFPESTLNIEKIVSTNELQICPGNGEVAINKTAGFTAYALQISGKDNGGESLLIDFSDSGGTTYAAIKLDATNDLIFDNTATGTSFSMDRATGDITFGERTIHEKNLLCDGVLTTSLNDLEITPATGQVGIGGAASAGFGLTLTGGMKLNDAGIEFAGSNNTLSIYDQEVYVATLDNTTVPAGQAIFERIGNVVSVNITGLEVSGIVNGDVSVLFTRTGQPLLENKFRPRDTVYFRIPDLLSPGENTYISFEAGAFAGTARLWQGISGGAFERYSNPNTIKIVNSSFSYIGEVV